ncbi:hypothetical protein AMELA_G00001770 [Ameiurus melas]|uniref:Uncharacterized protein n=1 Tax=Ameiurus melas TaxID=219545 RepID=A0A7J6BGN3_AMEME|nr:hypothetical protein AMELA_G00001770 [Ameiurus melas]
MVIAVPPSPTGLLADTRGDAEVPKIPSRAARSLRHHFQLGYFVVVVVVVAPSRHGARAASFVSSNKRETPLVLTEHRISHFSFITGSQSRDGAE